MSEQAAKDVGNIVERLLAGWPVYSVVLVAMWAYADLYLDNMISNAIKNETGQTMTVTALASDVRDLGNDVDDLEGTVDRLDTSIRDLNSDVKDTLRILANQ